MFRWAHKTVEVDKRQNRSDSGKRIWWLIGVDSALLRSHSCVAQSAQFHTMCNAKRRHFLAASASSLSSLDPPNMKFVWECDCNLFISAGDSLSTRCELNSELLSSRMRKYEQLEILTKRTRARASVKFSADVLWNFYASAVEAARKKNCEVFSFAFFKWMKMNEWNEMWFRFQLKWSQTTRNWRIRTTGRREVNSAPFFRVLFSAQQQISD